MGYYGRKEGRTPKGKEPIFARGGNIKGGAGIGDNKSYPATAQISRLTRLIVRASIHSLHPRLAHIA
jgi:hypothetical protein